VYPRGEKQVVVRANTQYNNITPVTDPEPYQQFFAALQKSMFLTAHDIDRVPRLALSLSKGLPGAALDA
jgi:hypothetical protein